MKPDELNDIGVERIMIALYVLAGNDLISAYKHKNQEKIDKLEYWLQNDPYGFLSDGGRVVTALRNKSKKGGWLKCPEFAKS